MTEGPAAPTPDDAGTGQGRSLRDLAQDRRLSVTALLAIAALIALAVWLIVESVGGGGSDGTALTTPTTEPVALSANGLATLAQASGNPIYWVGPRAGSKYELAQRSGQVFVRYLPSGVEAGATQALLTVATYPVEDAFDVTSRIDGGTNVFEIPGGGVAAISTSRPTSAYVAYPGANYQIELFDPDPAVVKRLARSGVVKPVPAPAATVKPRGPVAVSKDDLVALSDELGQPVYWAGARGNTTYELTVTAEGAVFVRYLAPGTDVGASKTALTVATYAVADGYAVTQRGASGEGSVVVNAPGGAFAMRSKASTHNVYLAYPGEDVQVEVYSPVPAVAARLVRRGQIVPVG